MKTNTLAIIAALGLLPITGFAQTPPAPPSTPSTPNQPIPPIPPKDKDKDRDRDKGPKVPVTFLGVETSSIPRVVSEQLGLQKGFGLVVDYVVPDGPAAAAGVQQNDIIKMFNDQILMEPDQLAKLVRSYPEGTSVTLTLLRKNAETKVTVKLGKKEVPSRNNMFDKHRPGQNDFGMLNNPDGFKFEFGDMSDLGPSIRETVRNAQREAQRATTEARAEARRASDEARRASDETRREMARARDEARRSAGEMRVFSRDKGTMKSTTIDLGKATIVFSDSQGEIKIENVNGKKMVTAKDPQGKLLFSGPVETKEELDKMPPEVRQRYEKLEQKDLPAIAPNQFVENDENGDDNNDTDDADDNDNDTESDDSSTNVSGATMEQVSFRAFPRFVRNLNIVSI
ncbi:MAG: serine protease Do [Verrucomicrobiota bacterium]|jgi:type II secretory pathway pseudopilin PulG